MRKDPNDALLGDAGDTDCLHLRDSRRIAGEEGQKWSVEVSVNAEGVLMDTSHRIRFVFVPKHTSWLNQVEIWFGVLVRRVIRRGSFQAKKDSRERLLAFIEYFNKTVAKPYKWTYAGRPLNV